MSRPPYSKNELGFARREAALYYARKQRLGRQDSGGPTAPVALGVPTIDITSPTVGDYLTGTPPAFSGTVTGYNYAWKRVMVGSPFTETPIAYADGTLAFMTPITATETILFGVQATGPLGNSVWVWSVATAAVANTYLVAPFSNSIGVWSPCVRLVSTYTGGSAYLADLTFNGSTYNLACTSKGIADVEGARAWWITNGGGNYSGVMPRVSKLYCQGTGTTSHFAQTVEANRPVYDFNNLRSDGLLPISVGSYGERTTLPDGSPITVLEEDTWMTVAGTTLSANTANHTVAMVVEGLTNIAVSSNAGYPSGPYNLMGMNCGTTSNRFSLQCGSGSWSSGFGIGIASGTTRNGPTTPLLAPANRTLITQLQSTVETCDGITPTTGTNAVSSIRVNNNTSKEWTGLTASRTSIAASSAGYHLGHGGSGAAYSGNGFAYYGGVHHGNSIVTAAGGDNRNAAYGALMKCLGVRDDYTTNFSITGASSVVGYAGPHGTGFGVQLANLLGPKVMVTLVAKAGAKNELELAPNKVVLASLTQPGLRNISMHYVASSDIGGGGLTGVAAFGWAAQFLAQIRDTPAWHKQYGLTFVAPRYQTASVDDPVKQAYNVDYNNEVINVTNQATYGYTAINLDLIPEFADVTDQVYRDGNSHLRAPISHTLMANAIAAVVANDIAP